jgi:putative ATPase
MDLFDFSQENGQESAKPLAERMRANNLNDFIGQKHIVAEGSLLRRAIALDRLGSCIFYGPPGTGKTTLANIIASTTHGEFIKLNAVQAGVADVKRAVTQAEDNLKLYGKRTYLMLDECHRFNKTQSDSLLPAIEQGTIIFIGSTTENPYAAMTPAIVSRCRIFEFKHLSTEDIKGALIKALNDKRKGLGAYATVVEDEALNHIAKTSGGDLRTAYNALELAVLTTPPDSDGKIYVKLADAEQSIQRKALSYNDDTYYDYLSAFCKSLRGSDSNAALYYAMRLIEGGCDPMLVARRLVVHSSEDVGMADPNALVVASSAMYVLEKTGYPEGLIPLSNAIVYVCEAPKSNAVVEAYHAAKRDAREVRDDDGVPPYLRDNSYGDKKAKAESAKYKYPHDYGGYVEQQYLPDSLKDRVYYQPKDIGYEKEVKRIRKEKGKKD